MVSSTRTVKIFYCYANAPKDSRLCQAFARHLSVLSNRYSLRTLSTYERVPVVTWRGEEEEEVEGIDMADLIFLLLSSDFLADPHCTERKNRALVRQSEGSAHIIPILLRKVYLEPTDLGGMQILPKNGRPVIDWEDQAFVEVVSEVDLVIKKLFQSWKTSDEWVVEGNEWYEHGQYEKALEAYEQATRHSYRDAVTSSRMGHMLYDSGRYKEALQQYKEASSLDGTDTIAYCRMGHMLYELKQHEEALFAYTRAVDLGHIDAVAFCQMGHILYELQQHEEALSAYMKAASSGHIDAQAWYRMGLIRSDRLQYVEALQAYEQALLLEPENGLVYVSQGEALSKLERYEEAL
jgi:Tfp pilus assembly protein PilF